MKKNTVEIEESEGVLFDLDEEESSSEDDDLVEVEETELSLVGSENMRSNLMTGGVVAVLLALGVLISKKFLGKNQNAEAGGSNYDPVNFEF